MAAIMHTRVPCVAVGVGGSGGSGCILQGSFGLNCCSREKRLCTRSERSSLSVLATMLLSAELALQERGNCGDALHGSS